MVGNLQHGMSQLTFCQKHDSNWNENTCLIRFMEFSYKGKEKYDVLHWRISETVFWFLIIFDHQLLNFSTNYDFQYSR